MDLLIASAMAQEAGAPAAANGSGLAGLLPLVVLFVIFYFLLIRPQQKRLKEHKQMVDALAKGDEVVTSGGVIGRITDIGEEYLTIEVANNVEIKVQRMAVNALLPKGTMKSL